MARMSRLRILLVGVCALGLSSACGSTDAASQATEPTTSAELTRPIGIVVVGRNDGRHEVGSWWLEPGETEWRQTDTRPKIEGRTVPPAIAETYPTIGESTTQGQVAGPRAASPPGAAPSQ